MHPMYGLSVALATPFASDGQISFDTLLEHIAVLQKEGVKSFTFFGTTGEGVSLSLQEKTSIISKLVPKILSPDQCILAVVASNVFNAKLEISTFSKLKIRNFLLSPPYYFKNITTTGLNKWFEDVLSFQKITSNRFIIYNIPQVTGVTIEVETIEYLLKEFGPSLIYGVKDSSGEFEQVKRYLDINGLMVAVGDERIIPEAMALGASGSICGMSNIFPKIIIESILKMKSKPDLLTLINEILQHPVTPAVKTLLALKTKNDIWYNVRSPLERISPSSSQKLSKFIRLIDD